MRKGIAAFVAVVVVSLSLASGGVAQARTRTPTPTSTAVPSATPSPTATAIPPDQIAQFQGQPWLDGWVSDAPVTAKIGDVDCGRPRMIAIVCDPGPCGPMWALDVVSSQIKAGCGYEGATIQFYVGDRPAQTAAWHGGSWQGMTLIVGPPFALTYGSFPWNGDLPYVSGATSPEQTGALVPYVGDVACGYSYVLRWEAWLDTPIKNYEYDVVVFSDQQQAGCGYEGAPITYKLLNPNGNVIAVAREKGVWHVWGGTSDSQKLALTMVSGGIRIGSVGTGDSQGGDGVPRGLVLGLALVGTATLATGMRLRKRVAR